MTYITAWFLGALIRLMEVKSVFVVGTSETELTSSRSEPQTITPYPTVGTHPSNPAVNTLPTYLLKDGSTNDYDEDFSR